MLEIQFQIFKWQLSRKRNETEQKFIFSDESFRRTTHQNIDRLEEPFENSTSIEENEDFQFLIFFPV